MPASPGLQQLALAPHRRWNALTGDWVLVSPQRTVRPWLGAREQPPIERPPAYDPACYLCPGNERAGGRRNPAYRGPWWFENDYPALLPETVPGELDEAGLLRAEAARGTCRVVCFSPRHDRHLSTMEVGEVAQVVELWSEQYERLMAEPWVEHVQIFENRGAAMGASNPHPHSQLWADALLPTEPARELARLRAHQDDRGTCLLCDYVRLELEDASRVVFADRDLCAVVPFWATWPFETLLLPRRHVGALPDLGPDGRGAWAQALQRLVRAYDRVFEVPFPYSMGFHQRPRSAPTGLWHLHAHHYPPLLRSATVRKFLVGYEMLAQAQRDLTPETAAGRLRELAA